MKNILFFITILMFHEASFGQRGVQGSVFVKADGSELLTRVSKYDGDPSESIYHSIEKKIWNIGADKTGGYFAIRVCSAYPLPVAFIDAPGAFSSLNTMKTFLAAYKGYPEYDEINILFLRNNKGCEFYKNAFSTEIWYVPRNAELPSFLEFKKPDDLTIRNLTFDFDTINEALPSLPLLDDGTPLTPENYKLVKKELVESLKKDKTAYLLLTSPAGGHSTVKIAREAVRLKLFLNQSGIGSHRIFIRKEGRAESNDASYPDVTIIYQK